MRLIRYISGAKLLYCVMSVILLIPHNALSMEQPQPDGTECLCTVDNSGNKNRSTTLSTSAESTEKKKHSWWRWILFPFRHIGTKITSEPCHLGYTNCSPATTPSPSEEASSNPEEELTLVHMRAEWGGLAGIVSHRWLEMETSKGMVTIGFGPATIPFIDTGQVGIRDEYGNVQRISGTHPVSFLTLPARKRNYAQKIGAGKEVGKPFLASREKVDEVIASESAKKGVFLYIPLFNDCRTYVCRLKAKLQGKTGIWCHLLLKGYW